MTTHGGASEWPHLEQYSDIPMFNTKAVVQRTGVAAPTLRAWERRYALIAPERADNAYRLYSERDIVLIRWLKERIDAGMSISQAVMLFRHLEEEQQQQQNIVAQPDVNGGKRTPENNTPAFRVAVPTSREHEEEAPQKNGNQRDEEQETWKWSVEDSQYLRSSYPTPHTMRVARDHLIEAFQNFDEQTAHVMMGSLLSLYSVEQVCMELLVPTLWQVGQLWSEGRLTVSVEHFASHFVRSFLMNRFHITPSPQRGPLVLACSAPEEPHEIAVLMLALFLRLGGMRVVYLGQSIEATGMLHTIKQLRPTLVCVSLTMSPYAQGLINLSRQIQRLPEPRPLFAFGGQAFTQYATIIPQIAGCYLDGDLREIVGKLRTIVQQQVENNFRDN